MLSSTSGYAKKNYTLPRMILPYKQTTLLVNELINLETVKMMVKSGLRSRKGKARKDRYSSYMEIIQQIY